MQKPQHSETLTERVRWSEGEWEIRGASKCQDTNKKRLHLDEVYVAHNVIWLGKHCVNKKKSDDSVWFYFHSSKYERKITGFIWKVGKVKIFTFISIWSSDCGEVLFLLIELIFFLFQFLLAFNLLWCSRLQVRDILIEIQLMQFSVLNRYTRWMELDRHYLSVHSSKTLCNSAS